MKRALYIVTFIFHIMGCNSKIKNSETKIEIEKGTEVNEEPTATKKSYSESPLTEKTQISTDKNKSDLLGFWVGYFQVDDTKNNEGKAISVDEGFYWNRDNKINISIDKITNSLVIGHSVVAGNNRPFKGVLKNGKFLVNEPGDHKYDGEFKFEKSGQKLVGKWSAYKNIEIKNRKYSLEKVKFSYNPDIMLERVKRYIDWNTFTEEKTIDDYDEGEFEEWIRKEFISATKLIYDINASNTLLKKKDVENLKKGDLTIIRNTIYARHGYSFKNRPLRIFFDAQDWYIPVHADIKSDFTNIEKENIKLLLKFEKNASEYYDYFGRG